MTDEITHLRQEVEQLRAKQAQAQASRSGYYWSPLVQRDWFNLQRIPDTGLDREAVKLMVENAHVLDFDHRLNTSSYVNVALEQEEEAIALMGLRVNLADQTVYPQSYKLHDAIVNMIANLWHCPKTQSPKITVSSRARAQSVPLRLACSPG